MPPRAIVQLGDEPPFEVPLPPGASAEPVPGIHLRPAEAAGLVVTWPRRRLRFRRRLLARGDRLFLGPGEAADAGGVRIRAVADEEPTAVQARALLLAALRGDADALAPALVARSGPPAGRRIALRDGVLGRGAGAAVRVDDATVSRRHARVRVDGARVLVEDLGSRNGLFVGAERVRALRELRPGEELRAGRAVLALGLAPPPDDLPPPPGGPSASRRRLAWTAAVLALAAVALAAALALAP